MDDFQHALVACPKKNNLDEAILANYFTTIQRFVSPCHHSSSFVVSEYEMSKKKNGTKVYSTYYHTSSSLGIANNNVVKESCYYPCGS
jgi:hypothetical protein